VVDSNWHPNTFDVDNESVHILKGVYVQPGMAADQSSDDLKKMHQLSSTPGYGGFPQAIVAWCDQSPLEISRLSRTEKINGWSISIDSMSQSSDHVDHSSSSSMPNSELGSKQQISDSLRSCFSILNSSGKSLDIQLDTSASDLLCQVLTEYPNVAVVLDLCKLRFEGKELPAMDWTHALEEFREKMNLHLKVTGFDNTLLAQADNEFLNLLQELIEKFGAERVLFASQTPRSDVDLSHDKLWSFYFEATRNLSAADRDKILRSNAIRIYRL